MKLFSIIPCVSLLLPLFCQAGGLTLGATRMIYQADRKEASVSLRNDVRDTPHLVQSWVSDFDQRGTENIPFITTPPLFKLAAGNESPVRVVYVGRGGTVLPKDRESLFLLNVRAIPAVEKKQNPTRLIIATQNIIKLIYRPQGLTAKEAGQAWRQLKVTPVSGGVSFDNPTPYVITLTGLSVNGKKVDKAGTIMPRSLKVVPVNDKSIKSVTFSTINDFGGITTPRMVNF